MSISVNLCLVNILYLLYRNFIAICRYIRHLAKVIPNVVEVGGEPTGY